MNPYTPSVVLTLDSQDYFGDDYTVAQRLGTYSEAVGTINSLSDVDVFEYTAVKEGLYIFESYGDTDTSAELYANGNPPTLIASDNNGGADNNFRLSAKLMAGQKCYLYVSGSEVGEYTIRASYAIGNIVGTVSPVKYVDGDNTFNELIEGKVTLTTYDTNEFVATMHLKEWSKSTSEYASFDMTGIHGGKYLVSFTRSGYLTRYKIITLNDNVVDLGNVILLAGDVNGDGIIDAADSALLQSLYTKEYGQVGYNVAADLNSDGIINSTDLALLTPNLNKNSNIYGESVNVITAEYHKSGSTLTISGTAAPSSTATVNVFQGNTCIFSENAAVNVNGTYSINCTLTKAGLYSVVVTASNRVMDVVITDINY